MAIIFWDFLKICQFFLSPQVTQSVIISNKHVIYESLEELPNHLRSKITESSKGFERPTVQGVSNNKELLIF